MRSCRIILLFLATSFSNLSTAQVLAPSDDESRVGFKIKNFGIIVDGSFRGLQGKIQFDPAIPDKAHIDVTVNANTIDTGIGLRDNHLRKGEYFNVKQFPQIRFVSTKVIRSAKPDEFIITGNLTIKNISREISFLFTYSGNGMFKGQFQMNRRDYNVGGKSISLADSLTVYLNVKVTTRI